MKTGKERQKEFRLKIKSDAEKSKNFREKENQRAELYRKRLKKLGPLSSEQLANKRLKQKISAAKYRAKKKEEKLLNFPYRSRQVLGKDVKKAIQALPKDPSRRLVVLSQITKKPLIQMGHNPDNLLHNTVRNFYETDDISRVSPRARDARTVIDTNGNKVVTAKRFMRFTISEAFELFKEKNPNLTIGRTLFHNLRPENVTDFSKTPIEMCICDDHENIKFIFEALYSYDPEKFSSLKYNESLYLKFVCENSTFCCFNNTCDNCKDAKVLKNYVKNCNLDLEKPISYMAWVKVTKSNRTADDNPHIQIKKVKVTEKIGELLKKIFLKVPPFLWHVYVQKNQSNRYKIDIQDSTNLDSSIAVCHVDFAENFHCFDQDQPQAAHFSQAQVSIFTVALWHRTECKTMAYVTDTTKHDKYLVVPILTELMKLFPDTVKHVKFYSDNARSQFKSKFVMRYIEKLRVENEKEKFTWNFFAEKHGKGVVDGIGATLKSRVSNLITNRRATVKNAADFASVCSNLKTEVVEFPANKVVEERGDLIKFFEKCDNLKNISKFYNFIATDAVPKITMNLIENLN